MKKVAKKFFRFLRGELNGYYIHKLAYFINKWVDREIVPTLYYMKTVQFNSDTMDAEDILNIAKTAGIVQAITKGRMLENTVRFTTSEQKEGNLFSIYGSSLVISDPLEVSERGLFDKEAEEFDFSFWDTPKPDIVDNATNTLQATLIPSNMPVLGYIKQDTILYDSEGKLLPREKWLLSEPPTDAAYSEFYGEQFLHFEEDFVVKTAVPVEVIYQVFVAIQEVRYNGSSIKSLAKLTSIIVGDVVKLNGHSYEIDNPLYIVWYYTIDKSNVEKPYVDLRINTWLLLVQNFFPQLRLEETI